jgi:capsular exopolysaccharide synthesis family protein
MTHKLILCTFLLLLSLNTACVKNTSNTVPVQQQDQQEPQQPQVQDQQSQPQEKPIPADIIQQTTQKYAINPFDLLEINVYQEPDLVRTVRVAQDGNITLPLAGKVQVSGLAVIEAEEKIAGLLKNYLVNPQVSVFIKEYNKKLVFIMGEVIRPGSYNIPQDKQLTVLEAITIAGGFTKVASIDGTRIIRVENGVQQYIQVRISDITKAGDKSKDIILKPNDIIFIPERVFVSSPQASGGDLLKVLTMDQQEQLNLFDYINLIQKRKWIILTCFVIIVTIVMIDTFKQMPVYRATAQLLIEKESSSKSYQEGITIDISAQDYYLTQYKIIKSRSLARKVVQDLRLDQISEFSSKDAVSSFLGHIYVEPIRGSRLVNLSAESYSPQLACLIANKLSEFYVRQNFENQLYSSRELLKKLPTSSIGTYSEHEAIQSLPSVVNNPLIRELKSQNAKYETEYAELSKRYKETHPQMIGLKAQISQLKDQINQETKNILESLKFELSGSLKSNNVRIIDPAEVPNKPVKPRTKRNILIAIVLGLFAGFGLAFLIEYLDNTIKSDKDIENYLGLVCLGLIPTIKQKSKKDDPKEKELFVLYQPKSPATESIKMVRTSIMLSKPKEKLKTFLLTSSGPGEGKTFSSVNLAITFAQNNEKIMLIDCDLRRSNVHKILSLDNSAGISNYLVEEKDLESIIQKTQVENLDVIPAGPHPPNPAELLTTEKITELVTRLKDRYDRIIFDTPPVLPVSDTINISNVVDGVIFVVCHGKIAKQIIKQSKQKLADTGKAQIIGVILNNIDIEAHSGYYYYPYYNYRYYNYGYADKEK